MITEFLDLSHDCNIYYITGMVRFICSFLGITEISLKPKKKLMDRTNECMEN